MAYKARQTVILGHGKGPSRTILQGQEVDSSTAAKAKGFVEGRPDPVAPVAPPAPAPKLEEPKAESRLEGGKKPARGGRRGASPSPTKAEVAAFSDQDLRQCALNFGVEFAEAETTEVIRERIVKELGLS